MHLITPRQISLFWLAEEATFADRLGPFGIILTSLKKMDLKLMFKLKIVFIKLKIM